MTVYIGIVHKFGRRSQNTRDRYKNIYLEYIESLGKEKYNFLKQEIQKEEITKQIVENINQYFIKNQHLRELSQIRKIVFDDGNIDNITDIEHDYDIDESIFGEEWKKKLIIHFKKERRSAFIRKCKQYFKQNHGFLYCEVCGDILTNKYGIVARNYIEAHHKVPLKDLTKETKIYIEDIAMVCPNCHGIIHSKNPCYTIDELKDIIRSQKETTKNEI